MKTLILSIALLILCSCKDKWEYKEFTSEDALQLLKPKVGQTYSHEVIAEEAKKQINILGQEGWEVIKVTQKDFTKTYHLKRKL